MATIMPDSERVSRLAFGSIFVALLVLAIKFAAWRMSGSVALYSDALESIVNVIAALIAWVAILVSRKPADKNHQFGHHKAEYFSAVVEGVLVVLAALFIFREAWLALSVGPTLASPGPGMAVNALAAAINGFWAWLLIRVGRQQRSPALVADGRHVLADVVTSIGVLAGLLVVLATGWVILDAIMAFIVGANVLREGWKVISESTDGLMDIAASPEETERIRQAILSNGAGAIEVHDIKTRIAGPVSFIEFHLVVDGSMNVDESHAICDRVEAALKEHIPGAQITIHVEPNHKAKSSGLQIG